MPRAIPVNIRHRLPSSPESPCFFKSNFRTRQVRIWISIILKQLDEWHVIVSATENLLQLLYYSNDTGVTTQYVIGWMASSFCYRSMRLRRTGFVFCRGGWAAVRKASWDNPSMVISLRRSGRVIFQNVSWLLSLCATYASMQVTRFLGNDT